jgi:NADH:ubiquinone oxidoreductase subunit 6 (subunit J)
MFTLDQRKYVFLTILFGTLTCLSHPESAVRAAVSAILLFLFFGRNRRGLINAFTVVGGVIILTAPWWGLVLESHGIDPFIAASRTGGHKFIVLLAFLLALLRGMLTETVFLTFVGSLAMLGIFLQLAKKEFFLPLWLGVTLLIEPRNSTTYLAPIVGMLAAVGAVDLLFTAIRSMDPNIRSQSERNHWAEWMLAGWMNKIIFVYLLIFGIASSYSAVYEMSRSLSATQEDLEAVEWINANVPAGEPFIFIKVTSLPEWFPVLTKANSVALVQGREWQNEDFSVLLDISNHLELCAEQGKECLENWQQESGLTYRYVYLGKKRIQTRDGEIYKSWPLKESLIESGLYQVAFESEHREILSLRDEVE